MRFLLFLGFMTMQTMAMITFVTGPMYSGKTKYLIEHAQQYQRMDYRVLVAKHTFDDRIFEELRSRALSEKIPAIPIKEVEQLEDIAPKFDVLILDEVQFFPKKLAALFVRMRRAGQIIVAGGLDTNFKKDPFNPIIPELLTTANKIIFLKAHCSVCKEPAPWSQRLHDGKPVSKDDPIVVLDGTQEKVTYEPRCDRCHVLT